MESFRQPTALDIREVLLADKMELGVCASYVGCCNGIDNVSLEVVLQISESSTKSVLYDNAKGQPITYST